MNDTIERSVTINTTRQMYVINHGVHISFISFDNAQDEIERVAIELVGRGFISDFPEMEEVAARARAQRGTLAAYDTLVNLREKLREVCEQQGERAVCDLTPQLTGLEGHRVAVITMDGASKTFMVGMSSGWMPRHLEVTDAAPHTASGRAADREYQVVEDLGRMP